VYSVALKVITFTCENVNAMAIISIETKVSTYPCESAVVPHNAVSKTIGKSGLSADMLYLPVIRSGFTYLRKSNKRIKASGDTQDEHNAVTSFEWAEHSGIDCNKDRKSIEHSA